MADALNVPQIFIDLTNVAARTIRAQGVRIQAIRIRGTAGAGVGDIVLRRNTAGTGPVVLSQLAAASSVHDGTVSFSAPFIADGLFLDAITTAWTAGSHIIVYTTEALT